MPSPGWARLRPCDRDLTAAVRVLMIGVSGLLIAAGAWSAVNFWRQDNIVRSGVNFTVYVYLIVFGVLLILAEVGLPKNLFDFFGFLRSSNGRAWFLFFASTFALSSGLSGNRDAIESILRTIAGTLGIATTVVALCYGSDHYGSDAVTGGGGGDGGGGIGGIGGMLHRNTNAGNTASARNHPDNVI
jgi:COPI associated protein